MLKAPEISGAFKALLYEEYFTLRVRGTSLYHFFKLFFAYNFYAIFFCIS